MTDFLHLAIQGMFRKSIYFDDFSASFTFLTDNFRNQMAVAVTK